MRRPGLAAATAAMRGGVWTLGTAAATLSLSMAAAMAASTVVSGCARARPCDGMACAAACPRNAAVDASGRCACVDGDSLVLGACAPPAVAAAFCGVASTGAVGGGCAFRPCGALESLDVATGACLPRAALPRGGATACDGPFEPLVESGRAACVPPDATCPRDAAFRSGACVRPPNCPAGTLTDGRSCRPIVTLGGRSGTRVDVGSWAAVALGVDGGRGSSWLCQPLAQRPSAFASDLRAVRAGTSRVDGGGESGGEARTEGEIAVDGRDAGEAPSNALASLAVRIAVDATFPDEDISRLHAAIRVKGGAGPGHSLAPDAEALAVSAVTSLLELLRSLGGEASAAAVSLEVTCTLEPPR